MHKIDTKQGAGSVSLALPNIATILLSQNSLKAKELILIYNYQIII